MTVTADLAGVTELVVLASTGQCGAGQDGLPQIAGFVVSSFSPLVADAAERCLRAHYGEPPADQRTGGGTAIVLASPGGDTVTARTVTDAVQAGRRVPPLLFFQSNPNAVLGHIAARWGLGGPVVCTSPTADALADGLAVAELLIAGKEAGQVLVIAADQTTTGDNGDHDRAEAVLVAAAAEGTP